MPLRQKRQKVRRSKLCSTLGSHAAPDHYLLLFSEEQDAHKMKLSTRLLFIKLCTAFSAVSRCFPTSGKNSCLSQSSPYFYFSNEASRLPQQLPWPHAPSLGLCKDVRREKGNKRRFLEQLPWPGFPSAALGSLQMGSATEQELESRVWAKAKGTGLLCIAGWDKASFISGSTGMKSAPQPWGQAEQRLQDWWGCVWPASPHGSAETQRKELL